MNNEHSIIMPPGWMLFMSDAAAPSDLAKRVEDAETAFIDDAKSLRELARRALVDPGSITRDEIQELGFALLIATRLGAVPLHGSGASA